MRYEEGSFTLTHNAVRDGGLAGRYSCYMAVTLSKLRKEARRLRFVMRKYNIGPAFALSRFWHLYRRDLFAADEIFSWGLLDPQLSGEQLSKIVSRERLLRLHVLMNPASHTHLTENKIDFHNYCADIGLPTARVLASYAPAGDDNPPWPVLTNVPDWTRFHDENIIDRFIVKPVRGVHGMAIRRLDRMPGVPLRFQDQYKTVCRIDELLVQLQQTGFENWLLEECVVGHPKLRELSGTEALQTTRVVTYIDPAGEPTILAAWFKIIGRSSVTDNFQFGATGNLVARVDPRTGVLEAVNAADADGFGLVPTDVHPKTMTEFAHFQLPEWSAVRELVTQAASSFRPLKTVGWDVGITTTGPILVEGNVTWDPLPGNPRLGEIYKLMARDLDSFGSAQ